MDQTYYINCPICEDKVEDHGSYVSCYKDDHSFAINYPYKTLIPTFYYCNQKISIGYNEHNGYYVHFVNEPQELSSSPFDPKDCKAVMAKYNKLLAFL